MYLQSRGKIVLKYLRGVIGAFIGAISLAVIACGPAAAQTISSNVDNGAYSFNTGQARFAQVLTAPNDRLTTFAVTIEGFGGGGTFVAQVYAWNGTALTGSPIYTSAPITPANGKNPYTFTPPAGGAVVTPGQSYALVFTATGNTGNIPYGSSNPEPSSQLWFASSASATTLSSLNANDAVFSATFAAAPPTATVPTLSEWAMIMFGVILAGSAALYIQRRRFTA